MDRTGLALRNVDDFKPFGALLVNPFDSIRNTRKSLCGTQPGHDRLLDVI
jgi:hypothetical protein